VADPHCSPLHDITVSFKCSSGPFEFAELNGCEWLGSLPGDFTLGEYARVLFWGKGLLGPTAVLTLASLMLNIHYTD